MALNAAPPVLRHRPHDLLWVGDAAALSPVDGWPAWATRAWRAMAPAVVRRAAPRSTGQVPVGLRGATRSERCAADALASQIVRTITPEDVAGRAALHSNLADSPLACLRTLARLAPSLDGMAVAWGVTGSVGFTLASGFDVLRADSDLDLLVRAADRSAAAALRALNAVVQAAGCRVDIQVETEHGAFALGEWIRTGGPVLLKTPHGPLLCADPWAAAEPSGLRPPVTA